MKHNLSLSDERIADAFTYSRLPFSREFSVGARRKLAKICSLAFDATIDGGLLDRLATYVAYVEKHMHGRFGGDTSDLIILYLMRYFSSLNAPDLETPHAHVEIGTLFGGTAILSCHATALAEREIKTAVIDPFTGYYDKGVDPITGIPVNVDVFRSNLLAFSVEEDEVDIIQGMSGDEDVIDRARQYSILSLFIDGDHTYDGVKNDWLAYSDRVVKGGYVLFDNYNDPDWPEVGDYVNNEVLSHMDGIWELRLVHGRSALLRRTERDSEDDYRRSGELAREVMRLRQAVNDGARKIEEIDEATRGRIEGVHSDRDKEIEEVKQTMRRDLERADAERALLRQEADHLHRNLREREKEATERETLVQTLQARQAELEAALAGNSAKIADLTAALDVKEREAALVNSLRTELAAERRGRSELEGRVWQVFRATKWHPFRKYRAYRRLWPVRR